MKDRKPWSFCETPEEKCTMNYCDENGCQNRKRNYVEGNDLIADVEEPYFDKNGKQIEEFAVIKIFHFKGVNEQGRGRKNYYMYKWVRLTERNGKKWWTALHLSNDSGDYFHLRSIANSERVLTNTEIVQQH